MKLIIASDHAGFANKQTLIQQLKAFGFEMIEVSWPLLGEIGLFEDG